MRKNRILIAGAAALTTAAVLIAGVIAIRNIQPVEASSRLDGVQKVIDELSNDANATLNLVEIVPDRAYSSLGYLVAGSEPTVDSRIIAAYSTTANRKNAVESLLEDLVAANIIQNNAGNYYREQLYNVSGEGALDSVVSRNETGTVTESRTGSYVLADESVISGKNYSYLPKISGHISLLVKKAGELEMSPITGDYLPTLGDELTYRVVVVNNTTSVLSNVSISFLNTQGIELQAPITQSIDGTSSAVIDYTKVITTADSGENVVYAKIMNGDMAYFTEGVDLTLPTITPVIENLTVSHSASFEVDADGNPIANAAGQYTVNGQITITTGRGSVDLSALTVACDAVGALDNWSVAADGSISSVYSVGVDMTSYSGSVSVSGGFSATGDATVVLSDTERSASKDVEFTRTTIGTAGDSSVQVVPAPEQDTLDVNSFVYMGEENGEYIWVDSTEAGAYTANVQYQKLYYQVDITSNNLFGSAVLELENGDLNNRIHVYSYTPVEFAEALANGEITINDIDLFYLSNTAAVDVHRLPQDGNRQVTLNYASYFLIDENGGYTNDLSWDVAYGIYESILNTNLPFVMDESIFASVEDVGPDVNLMSAGNNVTRLAYLARYQAALSEDKVSVFGSDVSENAWDDVLISKLVGYDITDLQLNGPEENVDYGTYGLVSGDIFIHGDNNGQRNLVSVIPYLDEEENVSAYEDSLNDVIFRWNWDNNSVASGYGYIEDVEAYLTGIQDILAEIENNSFYNSLDEDGNGTDASEVVSEYSTGIINQATFVKYILNYHYRRAVIYKDSITVLDLEPGKYSKLTEEMIRQWLSNEESENISNINIVQMSTSEFVGKLTDLTETYDLIYIGDTYANDDEKIKLNPSANNNVILYSHIGKLSNNGSARWGGLLDSEYNTVNHSVGETVVTYSYEMVNENTITDGTYLIVGTENGRALNHKEETANADPNVTDAIERQTGFDEIDSCLWQVTKSGSGYVLQVPEKELYLNITAPNATLGARVSTDSQILEIKKNGAKGGDSVHIGYKQPAEAASYYPYEIKKETNKYQYDIPAGVDLYLYGNDGNYYKVSNVTGTQGRWNWSWTITLTSGITATRTGDLLTLYQYRPAVSGWSEMGYLNFRGGTGGHIGTYNSDDIGCAFYMYKVTRKEQIYNENVVSRSLRNSAVSTRYAGNDITKENLDALTAYAKANYPIVISSTFLNNSKTVQGARLDTTSYMYQFIDQVKARANVYSSTSSFTNFARYLNMPKLYLTMIDWPVDYSEEDTNGRGIRAQFMTADAAGKHKLSYVFEFSNTSETSSSDKKYTVKLFEDVNADGKYSREEELDGLTVRSLTSNSEVRFNELVAGERYEVTRQLPDDLVGLVPWRLEVVMNDSEETVHTSRIGYCAISPKENPVTIEVLQILPESATVDMRNDPFKSLLIEMKNNYGYDVKMHVKTVSDVTKEYLTSAKDTGANNASYVYTAGGDNISNYYQYLYRNYDMLIIGFADTYEDFGVADIAKSIEMYIDSGKSVLFAHDTTSFSNATIFETLAGNVMKNSEMYDNHNLQYFYFFDDVAAQASFTVDATNFSISGANSTTVNYTNGRYYYRDRNNKRYYISVDSSDWTITVVDANGKNYEVGYKTKFAYGGTWYVKYWGYSMNQSIRAIVGMDRYGITKVNGLSGLSLKSGTALRASANTEILNDAYGQNKDYAFVQNSGTVKLNENSSYGLALSNAVNMDPYVQGFTDRMIMNSGNHETQEITQVNQGQITTYPYNLNKDDPTRVSASGSTTENSYPTIDVAQTHFQYYQLDLQLDKTNDGQSDIVVWYCLGGNEYNYSPNDVRNNYYIYNVGNVTYTGVGHSGGITNDEAKLFINTIIAAYNSGIKTPSITVVESETSKLPLDNLYRTFDNTALEAGDLNETMAFYVNDYNIIRGNKYIGYWYYREVTDTEYAGMSAADKALCQEFSSGGATYKVKPFTVAELTTAGVGPVQMSLISEAAYNSLPNATSGSALGKDSYFTFVENGVRYYCRKLENGSPLGVTLNGNWIDAQLETRDNVRVFVGAWTVLDYITSQADEVTATAFDFVTIRKRELLDID